MKKIGIIFKWIILSAIPLLINYLAESTLVFKSLKEKGVLGASFDENAAQDICRLISIGVTGVILLYSLIHTDIKLADQRTERLRVMEFFKEVFTASFNETLSSSASYEIRIFKPKHLWLWKFKKIFYKNAKLVFKCQNKESFANSSIKDKLEIEVFPKSQGLVGTSYRTGKAQFDDDLEKTNSENYNFTQTQVDMTRDLRFSLTYPVFSNKNSSSKDEVIAVIGIDSTDKIRVKKDQIERMTSTVNHFVDKLQTIVPDLFE